MILHRALSPRSLAVGAAAVLALSVAACGSSSSGQSTKTASSKPTSAKTSGLTISTAKSSMGTYLVGPSGRALYMWVADHGGKSSCSATCAQNWPPLTATSDPKAAGSAKAADLGTIVRSDGSKQVTYHGHPLYYYIADSGPGMTSGEGSNGFGAKWWLMAPSGAELTSGGSSSSSSTSSSSGGSSGGYG